MSPSCGQLHFGQSESIPSVMTHRMAEMEGTRNMESSPKDACGPRGEVRARAQRATTGHPEGRKPPGMIVAVRVKPETSRVGPRSKGRAGTAACREDRYPVAGATIALQGSPWQMRKRPASASPVRRRAGHLGIHTGTASSGRGPGQETKQVGKQGTAQRVSHRAPPEG